MTQNDSTSFSVSCGSGLWSRDQNPENVHKQLKLNVGVMRLRKTKGKTPFYRALL